MSEEKPAAWSRRNGECSTGSRGCEGLVAITRNLHSVMSEMRSNEKLPAEMTQDLTQPG